MKHDCYSRNLKVLRKRQPLLAKALDMEFPTIGEYIVEPARNGSPTLAIKTPDGKLHQIHSRYDPEKEAKQQIEAQKFRNPKLIIVMGLGLGYHIRAALEELKNEVFFIVVIERDIHALKAAVHHADISDLLESEKIRWAVGIPENEGFAVLNELIKAAGITLQLFLKTMVVFEHPILSRISGEYHRRMIRHFREAAHAVIFNYGNCPNDSLIGVKNIMRNLSVIMRNPGVSDLYNSFKGKPGIIVSSGPSLDGNMHLLKGIEDRCVMISADSALKVLLKNGIRPHMVSSLERTVAVAEFFRGLSKEELEGIWLAGTPVLMPEVYDAYKGETIIVYRAFAHFEWLQMPKGTLNIGPSCSNMAFKTLEAMGCNPIILVGQDLSFHDEKKTHVDGIHEVTNLKLKRENLFPVKGNFQDTVLTNAIFDMFRKAFVTDIAQFRGTCINATEGGAYIEGARLMTLREAIDRYLKEPLNTVATIRRHLHVPTESEIREEWRRFRKTMIETRKEVKDVIDFCDRGVQMVADFENELNTGGFQEIDDFLQRFPEDRLEKVYNELTQARGKVITFGKYFNLYLMHIVQMIIVKFEMDFNELPSLCEDKKRVKLQAIRMMRQWFPTISDLCRLSLQLLEEAYEKLEQEFGRSDA